MDKGSFQRLPIAILFLFKEPNSFLNFGLPCMWFCADLNIQHQLCDILYKRVCCSSNLTNNKACLIKKPHILQTQHQQPQQCVLPLPVACFLLAAIHHHPFLFINNNKPLRCATINFPLHPRNDDANQQRKKVVAGKLPEPWNPTRTSHYNWNVKKYWNIQDDHTKKPHIPTPQNSGHWHFMGALTLSFLFLKGPYSLAHHQFFWNVGHSPIEAPLWTTISDKSEVLLGTFWGNKLRTRGISWEHIWNMIRTRGKRKNIPLPHPLPKKKKLGPLMSPCSAFHLLHGTFISKTVCHHFWPGLMAEKKRKETGAWLVHSEPFIGCMQLFFVSKTICHHFGSRLIPPGRPLHSMNRLLIGCMKILHLKLAATNSGLPKKTLTIDL